MKDWSKERWRKLYVREALEQRPWPVMARGLRDYLLRLADDDGGLIRDADDPLGALLVALGACESEAELVRDAIELLRRDGYLAGTARSIFVANLPAAQSWNSAAGSETSPKAEVAAPLPQTSTERVRRHRERLRQASAAQPPTLRSATVNVSDSPRTTTTDVASAFLGNVSCAVPASRGSSDLISSGNFLDPKKDKQIDHHPQSSARVSNVSESETLAVATRAVSSSFEIKEDEEDEEERINFSGSREEALRLAVDARARLVADRPALADVIQPETWPEVARVAQVFARATGVTEQRLGRYQRDPGVRALVELYAAGFTQSELEHVVQVLPKQSWWQGKRLGLSSLSIEVVRRNLPEGRRQPLSPEVARVLEIVRRRRVG